MKRAFAIDMALAMLAKAGEILTAGAVSSLLGYGWVVGIGIYVLAVKLIEQAKA